MIKITVYILFLFFALDLVGQSEYVKEATKLIQNKKYIDALNLVNQDPMAKKSVDALLIGGIAKYHASKFQLSIGDLQEAKRLGGINPLLYKYLGLSFYALGYYEEAAGHYRSYLSNIDIKHPDFHYIKNEIYRCEKNLLFNYKEEYGFVENLGPVVNSSLDEIKPVLSPNFLNKYYFSSNRIGSTGGPRNKLGIRDDKFGHYMFDMYSTEQVDGNWHPSFIFTNDQNTSKNEILQDFSKDGKTVYFLKSEGIDLNNPILLSDTFYLDSDEKLLPKKINSHFRADLGDKDLFIFSDSLWLFSSKRQGGFGGYDIYSLQQINGEWQSPINLGPHINSAYDEVSPFLTRGSRLLFFSSNKLEGFGGFDIFFSNFTQASFSWEKPKNLGSSINSPMDDKDLHISKDGTFGIFSSNRSGGYGGFDIFQVFFNDQVIDQLDYTDFAFYTQPKAIEDVPNEFVKEDNSDAKPSILPKREYLNSPIYYNDNNVRQVSSTHIKNIQDLMLIYNNLDLIILINRDFDPNKDISLYQSVKTGESIANDIIKNKSIDPSRVNIIGMGSNMPIVTFESSASKRLNNRIEFIFLGDSIPELNIIEDPAIINNEIIGDGYYSIQLFKNRLSYMIPFATTSQMLRSDLVKSDSRVIISKTMTDPNYTYSLAFFKSYQDARLQKIDLLKKNLLNARVKPFVNGRLIKDIDLNTYLKKYEDLSEYKKYEIIE